MMRPPTATEVLLSDDGDRILEGSITNFFVVRRKDECSYEVQTAPVSDGVLPGVIRQLVIKACNSLGIPFREVAPSWADRDLWKEAFITSSLRLVQHVESIQVPTSCEKLHLKTWKDVSWLEKKFEGVGFITTQIQEEVVSRARAEGCPISSIIR
ncbi:uncharacterized protein A4U43_C02F2260 [Asparagus officinalis]|uniref:Uncharacterized protein n=1 Tax=Asparagus officinalis TaxID=4686 RepID=A0A5P1FF81_ASPOF|nr:uncharacterized protein LOC109829952 [Asparagus officinalis]ONK77018.1 uncharacterized protein A4U43_C02F2260 [Asparagus officinalis]